MELQRALEILGLESNASPEEVESAHRALCDDVDARIARASTTVIRRRFGEARAALDAARTVALSALGSNTAAPAASPAEAPDDDSERAWAVLGLMSSASPLQVASAYVSLCEELARELETAPTPALRSDILEARAEVDEAYRRCTAVLERQEAAPPAVAPVPDANGEPGVHYETQVATEAFEAAPARADASPAGASEDAAEVEAEDETAEREVLPRLESPPAAAGASRGRAWAVALSLALVVVGAVLGYAWWTDTDLVQQARNLVPRGPDPAVVEAQSGAEYLRRRVAEERRDLQARAEQTRERVARLEREIEAAPDEVARETLAAELTQARARLALADDLLDLSERHIFAGSDVAVAYGKMELGSELARAGKQGRALEAFTEASARLKLTLHLLDEAEEALGARSEALAAREAWWALARSTGLEESAAAQQGTRVFAEALAVLERGGFEAATPELRRASQHFRIAVDEGRRLVAEARAEAEARA